MKELIVEGLEPKDFDILEKILRTYSITIGGEVSYEDVKVLYDKIRQVQDHLR